MWTGEDLEYNVSDHWNLVIVGVLYCCRDRIRDNFCAILKTHDEGNWWRRVAGTWSLFRLECEEERSTGKHHYHCHWLSRMAGSRKLGKQRAAGAPARALDPWFIWLTAHALSDKKRLWNCCCKETRYRQVFEQTTPGSVAQCTLLKMNIQSTKLQQFLFNAWPNTRE